MYQFVRTGKLREVTSKLKTAGRESGVVAW
jgi:hypothetical protein